MEKTPLRILISGGGTGGHIHPAIAIAEGIQDQHPNAHIEFGCNMFIVLQVGDGSASNAAKYVINSDDIRSNEYNDDDSILF